MNDADKKKVSNKTDKKNLVQSRWGKKIKK